MNTANKSSGLSPLTSEELKKFLIQADKTLIACRSVSIEPDRMPLLAAGLAEVRFNAMQADDALLWFKWGDWTFKGARPVCELSDFLPDAAKVAQLRDRLKLPRKAIGKVERSNGKAVWVE